MTTPPNPLPALSDSSGGLEAVNTVSGRRGLLDAQGAAELLNVPVSWVRAETRADRIPYVPLGRYRRYEADVLEAWWRGRRRGPGRGTGLSPVSGGRRAQ
jgi:hypothetical protein